MSASTTIIIRTAFHNAPAANILQAALAAVFGELFVSEPKKSPRGGMEIKIDGQMNNLETACLVGRIAADLNASILSVREA